MKPADILEKMDNLSTLDKPFTEVMNELAELNTQFNDECRKLENSGVSGVVK